MENPFLTELNRFIKFEMGRIFLFSRAGMTCQSQYSLATLQLTDPNAGLDELKQRYKLFRDSPCYMTQSNEAAELLDHVPARFNRFIFYSGDVPHGAFITRPELLSSDPSSGRLTLNTFVNVRQR